MVWKTNNHVDPVIQSENFLGLFSLPALVQMKQATFGKARGGLF
jgi:hypothetical protein